MKALYITMLAAAVALVPSCANWKDSNFISANEVGQVSRVVPGTVISARTVRIDATSTDKNLGTIIGAAAGAGAGQMLGGGSGRAVSTVGFGIAGALAGRATGKYANQSDGQILKVKVDRTGEIYQVKQHIYEGIGPITEGMHGDLTIGSSGCSFRPDGY